MISADPFTHTFRCHPHQQRPEQILARIDDLPPLHRRTQPGTERPLGSHRGEGDVAPPRRVVGYAEPVLIERQSVVAAPAEQVWQRVVTPEGINDELRPWMTMSVPRGAKGMTVDTVPIGAPIGRAWLRLFGVLPFDYDRLSIAELEPGRRFREDSTMLSMRQWQHERTVTPEGDTKTIVRDRITFQTRAGLRFAAPLIAAGLRALFGHRHRRLQRHFAQG